MSRAFLKSGLRKIPLFACANVARWSNSIVDNICGGTVRSEFEEKCFIVDLMKCRVPLFNKLGSLLYIGVFVSFNSVWVRRSTRGTYISTSTSTAKYQQEHVLASFIFVMYIYTLWFYNVVMRKDKVTTYQQWNQRNYSSLCNVS